MNLTNQPAESTSPNRKKPYAPPQLTCYGHVQDIVQGGGGTGNDSGPMTKMCWVAEALYGVHDPRTILLRAWLSEVYVLRRRGWLFAALYMKVGHTVADLINGRVLPRRSVRPLFDRLLVRAFEESARTMKEVRR